MDQRQGRSVRNLSRAILLLISCWLPIHAASGQILEALESEFKGIADAARPCCVRVEVIRSVVRPGVVLEGQEARNMITTVEVQNALSGFLLDDEGYVVTLGEALNGATRVWVSQCADNETRRYKADVVGFNLDSNVGLLSIRDNAPSGALPLGDSDQVEQGAIIFGLGYTYTLGSTPSFSVGVVNATDRLFRSRKQQSRASHLIQASLALHAGETGGPVINSSNEVVGLMLTSYNPGSQTNQARTGRPQAGVVLSDSFSLVLPINRVKKEVEWILDKQKDKPAVSKKAGAGPWLGLTAGNIADGALRKQLKIPEGGVLVSYIFPGDPAERAGIKENDVLMQWDGVSIQNIDHLKDLIGDKGEGDPVGLVLIRAGKEVKIQLRLGEY